MDHTHTFLTTQGHGGPPRMSDQLNAEATSETAQIWKTIHTKHTLSHPNKANMEWLLRRPNDIRGPWGPKVSWHLSYKLGKTPKKTHPGNLSRPGIEPGSAAWQARMLPLTPQRWTSYFTKSHNFVINFIVGKIVSLLAVKGGDERAAVWRGSCNIPTWPWCTVKCSPQPNSWMKLELYKVVDPVTPGQL